MNILGTEYTVKLNSDLIHKGCDGICDTYSKVIEIRPSEDMLENDESTLNKTLHYKEEQSFRTCLRHQVAHPYDRCYAKDESHCPYCTAFIETSNREECKDGLSSDL